MKLIDQFHKMENEFCLFELGTKDNLPIWDIVRYNVYLKYYYPEKDRKQFETEISHNLSDYFYFILLVIKSLFYFIISNGKNVFITSSRYQNHNGFWFDKSAQGIIEQFKKESLILEPVFGKKNINNYVYDISNVLRRFYRKDILNQNDFKSLEAALISQFGVSLINYKEINKILLNFISDFKFYSLIFKMKKTQKLFISTGNPRALILASKKLNIKSYLIQHGSIEFDSIDLSYPKSINDNKFILLPDFLLTFGSFWCKDLNIPNTKIVSIGNDYFSNKIKEQSDNSVLIISTIIHGDELKKMTKIIAEKRQDLVFKFKLHPNEFKFYQDYVDFFKNSKNVIVISNQQDTSLLISKSNLVVLIVSTVVYEALDQNKKVAIYMKINYERQLHLKGLRNLYFFNTENEFINIYNQPSYTDNVGFYEKLNIEEIKKL